MKQVLTVLFFNLYYLYCLSIFQRTCCFRFKSGCKGKRFIFNCQIFSEVFFIFSFQLVSQALLRKGKNNYKRKKQNRSLCESDCKDKNFMLYPPNFFGSFFVLMFKPSYALSLSHFIKAFFSRKADAKVLPFGIHSKYIQLFFLIIFE